MFKTSSFIFTWLFIFSACQKIDPESSVPVLQQLENTSWKAELRGPYRLEFKSGGRVKVHLGGVLGLAESPAAIKYDEPNFVLASLYEDTPNPFLFSATILSPNTIKVYIWPYTADATAKDARLLLDEQGVIFKRS